MQTFINILKYGGQRDLLYYNTVAIYVYLLMRAIMQHNERNTCICDPRHEKLLFYSKQYLHMPAQLHTLLKIMRLRHYAIFTGT